MSTSRLVIIDDGFQLRGVTVSVDGLAGATYTATAIDFSAAISYAGEIAAAPAPYI